MSQQCHDPIEECQRECVDSCQSEEFATDTFDNDDDDDATECDDSRNNIVTDDATNRKHSLKDWIFVGSTVLARWCNGLWYLGVIIKISPESECCSVRFEDDSVHWIRYSDLHKQLSIGRVMADSDILCSICRDGTSEAPNEIVICDVCNQGYHQKCHKPNIGDDILLPDVPWSCRLCVFALGTKEGGAEKNGIIGKSLRQMKTELPYDIKSLRWDSLHQVNDEGRYCYCGGPGVYYKKMLQCEKCLQWFHEACIQALETPLLYGDHYYTFVCAICNYGKESAKRIIMKWSDVVALVLHNLSLQHDKKLFDLYSEVVPFFQNNCHMLKLSEDISKLKEEEIAEKIIVTLCNNKKRFVCGKERKKRSSYWGLRYDNAHPLIFAPPFALSNSPPKNSFDNLPSIIELTAVTAPSPSSNSSTPSGVSLMYGACRKGATVWPKVKNNKKNLITNDKKRVQKSGRSNSCSSGSVSGAASTVSTCSGWSQSTLSKASVKTIDISKRKKPLKLKKETSKRTKRALKFPPPINTLDIYEASSNCTIESLDAVIPVPSNFDGDNNPFVNINDNLFRNCLVIAAKRRKTNDNDHVNLQNNACVSVEVPSSSGELSLINHPKESSHDMKCFIENKDKRSDDEKFNILARRVTTDGTVEYLLEWDNN